MIWPFKRTDDVAPLNQHSAEPTESEVSQTFINDVMALMDADPVVDLDAEEASFHDFMGFAPMKLSTRQGDYADPDVCEDWKIWIARAQRDVHRSSARPSQTEAEIQQALVDQQRWHMARDLFSHEDVERAHHQAIEFSETESRLTDAAIDAVIHTRTRSLT